VVHEADLTKEGWQESWTLGGVPKGETVTLRREGLSEAVRVEAGSFYEKGTFRFASDGLYRALFSLPEGER
jgi:hypothetical protein